MANKSTKTPNSKSVKLSAKVATKRVSSKSAASKKVSSVTSRGDIGRVKFLGICVLISAALIAIAIGISGYKRASVSNMPAISGNQAAMFIGSDGNNSVAAGSTLTTTLYENSGSQPVNAVQSAIQYPAEKLQFVSIKTGQTFSQEAATDTKVSGLIRLARSIGTHGAAVNGPKVVATIEFKVLPAAQGQIVLQFDKASSLVVRSTDNQNLLQQTPSTIYRITR